MNDTFTHGGRAVDLSSPDKLYFPEAGLTKSDILDYYRRVGPRMLSYLESRPLSMRRFPEGIEEDGFFQKQVPDHFPEWIPTITVEKRQSGESQQIVCCDNLETLIYLANQGCLEFHPWLSTRDHLDKPDRAVIDLDPSDDSPTTVLKAARHAVDWLGANDLQVRVLTTGSSGYHLVLPLDATRTFDQVRKWLAEVAQELTSRHPKLFTTQQRKSKRGDRVYLDIARNAYAQTSISIYSVRARPAAPVATPLRLEELDDFQLHPRKYTVKNLFRRLGQLKTDPWE